MGCSRMCWTKTGLVMLGTCVLALDSARSIGAPPPTPMEVKAEGREGGGRAGMPADEFRQLVGLLESKDFGERESATKKLREDERLTFKQVEALLQDPASRISVEARVRLLSVGHDLFVKEDRAALGFQFGGQLSGRVVVSNTFPKFPAYKKLEPGDMIIEVAGVPVSGRGGTSGLQSIIVSRDPGDQLDMVIRRGAEKVRLSVELGRYNDLDQAGMMGNPNVQRGPNPELVERAWRVRSQSLGGLSKDVVKFDIDPDHFSQTSRERRQELIYKRLQSGDDRPIPVGGGTNRGAGINVDGGRGAVVTMNRRIGQLRVAQVQGGWNDQDLDWAMPKQTPAEELRILTQSRVQAEAELKSITTNAEQFDSADNRIGMKIEIEKRLKMIDRQRQAVEAEIAERGEAIPQITSPDEQVPQDDER